MNYPRIVRLGVALCFFISVADGVATLGGSPSNASALQGTSASFSCEVVGPQGLGEDLQFYKTSPAPSVLLALNANLRNESRYNVSDTYTYTIISVLVEDEGKYECVLFPTTLGAYLSVSVAPEYMTLSWPSGSANVQKATPTNLTCTSVRSRPPATHRWFMGTNDITSQAAQVATTTDSQGYGDSVSYIELTLQDADNYAPLQCVADLPGATSVQTVQLRVAFSGSSRVYSSSILLLTICFILFHVNW